jgi:hypothetical protein
VRPAALDPDPDCVGSAPHGQEVLGQQQARRHAQPPLGGLPKPVNRVPETSRQTPDQQFQPAFLIIFLISPRSSGQCRAGRVSLCMDTQKSGSFLHEPRRTSDAETVEKWGF